MLQSNLRQTRTLVPLQNAIVICALVLFVSTATSATILFTDFRLYQGAAVCENEHGLSNGDVVGFKQRLQHTLVLVIVSMAMCACVVLMLLSYVVDDSKDASGGGFDSDDSDAWHFCFWFIRCSVYKLFQCFIVHALLCVVLFALLFRIGKQVQ